MRIGNNSPFGYWSFCRSLSGDESKDVGLIGQFGVGFYSAFMVAEKVDVITRKAGENAWRWSSDGLGEYTVEKASKEDRGSSITLYLKKDAKEFLEDLRLRTIVKAYSDHISIPIVLVKDKEEESLMRPLLFGHGKEDITQDQYTEFYRHVSSGYDEPWMTSHWRAEGRFTIVHFIRPF